MKFKITNITSQEGRACSILIVYTGGTFGMVYDESGSLVPFNFSLVLEKIPELKSLDLNLTVISFPDPVDSSNISTQHWADLGYIIYNNYHQYDGFIILHGTDTMAYSASALSFLLDGLNKPVIFTGAQIPIGAIRSDARENLITAIEIASKQVDGHPLINEVCLYFNFVLLRGNRSQKIRSSTFAAFESENYPNLAQAGVDILYYTNHLRKHDSNEKLSYKDSFDENVSLIKIFPNIQPHVIEATLSAPGLKGVVLETYGSGNTMKHSWFIDILKEARKNGILIMNVSQCIGGSVLQGRYETSKELVTAGVISGFDITTEAAITKMMYLFGNETSVDRVEQLLKQPIKGEMTI